MQSLTWETIHSTVHSCHRSTILCLVQAGKPVWTFSRLHVAYQPFSHQTSPPAKMAKLVGFFLVASQIFVTHSLPAGELKSEPGDIVERAITISTDVLATTSYSRAIETLQSISVTIEPSLTGTILTALPSNGVNTKDPVIRPIPTTVGQPLCPNETPLDPGPTASVGQASDNIFQPVATTGPAASLPFRSDHIVKKQNIVDENVPIQTNKFYANFFLGSQSFPVWTHPYSLTWAKGVGGSFGMAVTHTVREQFAFGPNPNSPQYFISPIGIHHLVLSAAELGRDTHLSLENLQAFSTYANLAASAGSRVVMSIPCVQGMGFVTALYDRAQPVITTGVFFRTLNYISVVNGIAHKYRLTLNDGSVWLLYATSIGSVGVPPFTLDSSSTITGPRNFQGMIQVTKNPSAWEGEDVFDMSAGSYAINATISASVSGQVGKYSLSWAKGGVQSQTLLMYALPHHVESFDQETRAAVKNISLVTTTKGYATAVLADRITMVEDDLPVSIAFAPWAKHPNGAPGGSGNINLQPAALNLINQAGIKELGQDFDAQTRLNSMYYSGKGLAKFAAVIYTLNSMTGNSQYAAAGLDRLKDAFNVFVNNTQPEPLVYDQVWKGVVSSATYKPPYDTGLDFGNTLYNDHHFHYGYFVWTAAVIGHLDPTWLDQGINKDWVNTLVRDYANPVNDAYYPFQRSFDWFHGHSWAKGLFESGDGKDQESTSEDTFATYALKMWGRISRDPNMEARGNLQLALQARSLKNYFLMTSDNKNQPPQFVPNKVTGILFENKIDHTTYFGGKTEYIEGIHMIPLNPSSAYTRSKQFVQEEWDTYFSNGRVDQVVGGWKAILYANLALIDPEKSYKFFADPEFNTQLDGGASRTWYLAYSAAMMSANSAYAMPDPNLTLDDGKEGGEGPLYIEPNFDGPEYTHNDEWMEDGMRPEYIDPDFEGPQYTHNDGLKYVVPPKMAPVETVVPGAEWQRVNSLDQEPQATEQQSTPSESSDSSAISSEPTDPQSVDPQDTQSQSTEPSNPDSESMNPNVPVLQDVNLEAAQTPSSILPSLIPAQPTSPARGTWPIGFTWPKPNGPRPTPSPKPSPSLKPTFVWPRPTRTPTSTSTARLTLVAQPMPTPELVLSVGLESGVSAATMSVLHDLPVALPRPTIVYVQGWEPDGGDGERPDIFEFSGELGEKGESWSETQTQTQTQPQMTSPSPFSSPSPSQAESETNTKVVNLGLQNDNTDTLDMNWALQDKEGIEQDQGQTGQRREDGDADLGDEWECEDDDDDDGGDDDDDDDDNGNDDLEEKVSGNTAAGSEKGTGT
ncbi:hypothetical protein LEMA_P122920.1 [Plenodomus lingam JN3]|uniref:glucan endo-1,3-beta-D-glucosidase n=1 Tax=Leptosphaeria maculans (strain JN3 / isolate v23.1.3 / race Av1-4-5-6-7-8) TaxID=985895 RepID=E4ZSD3_LEPMJ|nr:hypothetical protein LEMA_P122920.1 [Plenodomus lingam JN3]CBX94313.1 hypothetical protein LEMA_P122920.1 [Plenodomus lingam JN3]